MTTKKPTVARIVVHEDGNPFIRMETFTSSDELKLMLSRTHNGLLDKGYALMDTKDTLEQRAATYHWVRTPDSQPRIHVVVLGE